MAEPIESGECDVCADAQFTDNGFNGANQLFADTERHANVLGLIGNYPLEDAQRYIILEAGIDKQRISALSVFLYANTSYFDKFRYAERMKYNESVLTIEEVKGDILQVLIAFCYTGLISITTQNVDQIYAAALLIKFTRIQEFCVKFYLKYNSEELQVKVDAVLLNKFQIVAQEEDYRNLNVDTLKWLLQNDNIYVYSEEEIFNALIRWIEFDEEKRKEHFSELLPLVRIQQVKQTFLANTVRKYCQTWDQSNVYSNLKDIRDDKSAIQMQEPRLCISQQPILLSHNGKGIVRFDLVMNEWYSVYNSNSVETPDFVVQNNDELYMMTENKKTSRLNLRTGQEVNLAPRICDSMICKVTVLNNKIYCLSSTLNDYLMEKFDASSGEWTAELAAIDKEYYEYTALQMVAYNDCLYVIADNMHGHTITFCYNPKLNKWNRLADVLINSESDLEQCQLFVRNDVLTFIHTFDELINIYVYDLKADNWNKTAEFGIQRHIKFWGSISYDDILYIYTRDYNHISSIYKLSIENDSLDLVTHVPEEGSIFFIKPYDPLQ